MKSKGYSTTAVANDDPRAASSEIQKTLPPGVDAAHRPRRRRPRRATRSRNVQEALIEGALLTVLVVFLFLNSWRSTVITGLALPVSVLASFVAVWAFGFTLNTMSLLGLSLAIGILIDDAIVVRENIVRHVEMGKDHFTASHEGTDEIGLAVAATTFSIVVVFVPIAFMGGIARAVVRAVRADDRLLGAGVAVRVVLARPDAVGVLARSARADREARRSCIARARPVQRVVRSPGRTLQEGDRLGARSPLVDGRRSRCCRSSARWRCRRSGFVGGGFFPVTDDSEFNITLETPPGSNLDTRG